MTDPGPSRTEVICTLGPSSFEPHVIQRLTDLGVSLFRLNLSHTPVAKVAERIEHIRKHTSVPLCLDTEGAQLRTGDFAQGSISLEEHQTIQISARPVLGRPDRFNLNPAGGWALLEVGDLVALDFNVALIQIIGKSSEGVTGRVLCPGRVGSNKAVSVDRPIELPALTDKDRAAVTIGVEMGIRDVALSFAGCAQDVRALREQAAEGARIIAKIESLRGLEACAEICHEADAILIDRGDLSREVPHEKIPGVQARIMAIASAHETPVYVATNLLESMLKAPTPTLAEVNDIHNALRQGAKGLVLAAETAIGRHPIASARMVCRIIDQYERESSPEATAPREPRRDAYGLIAPHGGELVRSIGDDSRLGAEGADEIEKIRVGRDVLTDVEQLAHGMYSPLAGFMDRETLEGVLDHYRLPSGVVWTLPIVLGVGPDDAKRIRVGETIALVPESHAGSAPLHSLLEVTEVYPAQLPKLAERWFGTDDHAHPGVRRLRDGGSHFVAGKVMLLHAMASSLAAYQLKPSQSRSVFDSKGWNRVVGFHTRNVAHRAHEYLQTAAMERSKADGLLISPVVGSKKPHDFLPEPILESYEMLLGMGVYPPNKVVLGAFETYSRYAGPREAIFTALCRKNMGCSHFIIGRDHTGVGDYYEPDAARRFFDELPDLGIAPVYFEAIGYDSERDRYVPLDECPEAHTIAGTDARKTLISGGELPDWYMRVEIQQLLREYRAAGRPLVVAGD